MIVCIIQARMGSTRLPGKVSRPILGKPMLARQIERVKQARLIDKIVVATTTKSDDDIIFSIAHDAGVGCFRGSENDVLGRYYQAAKKARADIVIRITGDCPLSDPKVIDETIGYFLKNIKDIDYTSKPINYPEGLDMEIFQFNVLERAWKEAIKPSEREHVTPYIYNHPEIFRIRTWQNGVENLSAMHWSVDTSEDFLFITKIFEKLYPQNPFFSKDDVVGLLQKEPKLLFINDGGTGYEGYNKSLKEDEQFQQKQHIYEQMMGFVPEAIVLVSGGIVKEVAQDGVFKYRSTRTEEGDAFGILWGEARVLATAELAIYFPKAIILATGSHHPEQTQAVVFRDELEQLSVSRDRIILEGKSTNTLSQIGEVIKFVYENGIKKVVFITNEYHISRLRAMYEHFESLIQPDTEIKQMVKEVKSLGVQIQFVAAEFILPYRDKKFIKIIDEMEKSPAYIKRLQNEERGVAMIKSGEYGKEETVSEDKLERKV